MKIFLDYLFSSINWWYISFIVAVLCAVFSLLVLKYTSIGATSYNDIMWRLKNVRAVRRHVCVFLVTRLSFDLTSEIILLLLFFFHIGNVIVDVYFDIQTKRSHNPVCSLYFSVFACAPPIFFVSHFFTLCVCCTTTISLYSFKIIGEKKKLELWTLSCRF